MNSEPPAYSLEPTPFRLMLEAQELTAALEENLNERKMGAANTRPVMVEIFSELVNSAAEHGMSEAGAHVRFMPHRRGKAFDAVIADPRPGIRATLSRNPELPETESGRDAIGLAVQ